MLTRARRWLFALVTLPGLLLDTRQRRLFYEMRAFARRLPMALAAPLPEAMAAFTPAEVNLALPAWVVRDLADLTALLDRQSPFGLCLRRSLVRYHFLRRAGVPVAVQFGARFKAGLGEAPPQDRDVTGHAWVMLNGQPYFEDGENYRGFTVMLSYPQLQA